MSNPVRSLASRVDWRKVFAVIGLEDPRRSDLPQSMLCPLCETGETGMLTVMSDQVLHGQWFHCATCQFAGDVIEFAARVLNCSIEQTIDYCDSHRLFETSLCDDDVAAYQSQQVQYRARIKKFWETAKRAPAQSSTMGTSGRLLLRRYSLQDLIYRETWNSRGGQLFGVAERQEIENLFAPKSFEIQERVNRQGQTSRRRGGGPGNRRVFSGGDWDEVLVIAHSDLPGRVVGFTFIGRDFDQPEVTFKRVNLGCCVSRPRESGFGFLEAVNGIPHSALGRHVFVFLDVEIASLLHARHFREGIRPLPILLAKSTRDVRPLSLPPDLEDCKLIFCGPQMETLPLAKAYNGWVSMYSVPELEIQENLKHRSSLMFLSLFQRRAIPWTEALRRQLSTAPKAHVEVLLHSLQLSPHESEVLQRGLGGVEGERFAEVTPHRLRGKQIPVGPFTVEETKEGWIARKSGTEHMICSYPIRIESIYKSVTGNVAYHVAVYLPNETVRFIALARDLNRTTLFDMVANELRDQSHEHLAFARHKWAKQSLSLALEFSEPQMIPFTDRVGWNAERMRFQFPQFAILSTGDVDSTPMPIVPECGPIPAADLSPPFPSRQAAEMLSQPTFATGVIWALAACVAHNLLAGNCTRQSIGVILDGPFAQETGGKAAAALGCGCVDVQDRRHQSVLKSISTSCGAHDFPSVVNFGFSSKLDLTTDWIDDLRIRHAILPLPSHVAIAVALNHGFVRIRSHEFPVPLGSLASAAGWIIPSYLADLCRRKKFMEFPSPHSELVSVLHDMASWFERNGGNPKAALRAESVLTFDAIAPARAFVELIEHLQSNQEIACGIRSEMDAANSKVPVAVIFPVSDDGQSDAIQVRHWVINEVLRRNRVLAIQMDEVQADLEFHSAMRGTIENDEGITWLIDAGWWKQVSTAVRQKLRPTSTSKATKVSNDGPSEYECHPARRPSVSEPTS